MSAESQDVAITAEKLHQELRDFFDNDDATMNEWLDLPLPILSGECPRNILDTPEGHKRLYQILEEMKFGEMA